MTGTLSTDVRQSVHERAMHAADQVTRHDRSKGSGWRQVYNAERRVLCEEMSTNGQMSDGQEVST